mgnify:CR=1 FL=1
MKEKTSWHKPSRIERKESLQKQAISQKKVWDALTTIEKIEALDKLLGPNMGATKQRAKLKALLEKEFAIKESAKRAKASEKEDKPKKTKKKSKKD